MQSVQMPLMPQIFRRRELHVDTLRLKDHSDPVAASHWHRGPRRILGWWPGRPSESSVWKECETAWFCRCHSGRAARTTQPVARRRKCHLAQCALRSDEPNSEPKLRRDRSASGGIASRGESGRFQNHRSYSTTLFELTALRRRTPAFPRSPGTRSSNDTGTCRQT